MTPEKLQMEQFKSEVRNDLKELTSNINKLTDAVGRVVTTLAVTEEQKRQQEATNIEFKKDIRSLKSDVAEIKLERAKESQSRGFLMKWWPFLLFAAMMGTAFLTAFFSGFGKALISG